MEYKNGKYILIGKRSGLSFYEADESDNNALFDLIVMQGDKCLLEIGTDSYYGESWLEINNYL